MSAKLKLSVIGFVLTIFLTGFWISQDPPASEEHSLAVMNIDGIWKVVNPADSTFKLIVHPNDKIVWTTVGTNALFKFNDDIFDSTGANYSKYIKDGKELKLKIKDKAKKGIYEYSVFCTPDSVYAIGGSPPKIIVE